MYTVIGVQPVSEAVLYTVLLEVEAILNAKPLCYTSSSVADLDLVTPNFLLMGRLDGALPSVVYPKCEGLSKRTWRHGQVMADHFWARFIRCYLPTLQCRQKCYGTPTDLSVDSVVLVIDPQFPWALLPVGRVIRVHQSANGHVRSSDIQVKDKVYIQPVAQLIRPPSYYVKSIGGVVTFLCINEQGLRGTTETTSNNDTSAGLFLNLFEYTLEKDAFLADIEKGIPKHAKYTSKDIQNEIIETLAIWCFQRLSTDIQMLTQQGFALKVTGHETSVMWKNVL